MNVQLALSSWAKLCNAIMRCDESEALELLFVEKKGRNRRRFIDRIESRLTRLRRSREVYGHHD